MSSDFTTHERENSTLAQDSAWEDLSQSMCDLAISTRHRNVNSEVDANTLLLLDLVEQYQALTRQTRLKYIQGYLNLSRANFHAGLNSYGPSAFDMRPHEPCLVVETTATDLHPRDVLCETSRKCADPDTNLSHQPKKGIESIDESQNTFSSATGSDSVESKAGNKPVSRKRNTKVGSFLKDPASNAIQKIEKSKESEPSDNADAPRKKPSPNAVTNVSVKDPIYQFGGLVPIQLRNAQSCFKEAINGSILEYNLKKKLLSVIAAIEDARSSNDHGSEKDVDPVNFTE